MGWTVLARADGVVRSDMDLLQTLESPHADSRGSVLRCYC